MAKKIKLYATETGRSVHYDKCFFLRYSKVLVPDRKGTARDRINNRESVMKNKMGQDVRHGCAFCKAPN